MFQDLPLPVVLYTGSDTRFCEPKPADYHMQSDCSNHHCGEKVNSEDGSSNVEKIPSTLYIYIYIQRVSVGDLDVCCENGR